MHSIDDSGTRGASHRVRDELRGILTFLGVIWAVFLVSRFVELSGYGLRPRTLSGLVGIVTMPFLHQDFSHLLSNSVPLFVLLALLAGSRAQSGLVVASLILLGGGLLWAFSLQSGEPPKVHLGASGLVYGLATFLVLSGFLERRPLPLLIALLVLFFFGTSMLAGVLPKPGVSWDGHLYGALAGGLLAYGAVRDPKGGSPSQQG